MDKKAVLWLYSQLPDLINKNIIDQNTANKLKEHYGTPEPDSKKNIILTIFGILGAIFIGLGIILVIGYNWDDFSRTGKTILSLLPLIISQAICAFVILKKYDSVSWREASSIFLMSSVGASIALVSQTYHIAGDFTDFLLSWMLLSMPLIYIMRVSTVAFFYLVGITFWSGMTTHSYAHLFWLLIAFLIPKIVSLIKENPYSSSSLFMCWAIPISIGTRLILMSEYSMSDLWLIIFTSYFSLLYLSGQLWFNKAVSLFMKPFQVIGMVGIISLASIFTYGEMWKSRSSINLDLEHYSNISTDIIAVLITLSVFYLLYKAVKDNRNYDVLIGGITLLSLISFALINYQTDNNLSIINQIIYNIYLFSVGVFTLVKGTRNNSIFLVNGGMLIIALLIMLRFFDVDLSFLLRGIIFILIGVAFFISNYIMVRKTKEVRYEK